MTPTRPRRTAFFAAIITTRSTHSREADLRRLPHHTSRCSCETTATGCRASRTSAAATWRAPPLWHTAAKMPHGRWFTDGSFHGPFPLMASSMELEKDRSFDALVETVVPAIKQEFDRVIRHLRPPRYPYEIDRDLAARGRALFESRETGCSGCHGVYDGQGNVKWPGTHVDVVTDAARIAIVSGDSSTPSTTARWLSRARSSTSDGYAATPLTGVWAKIFR